MKGPGPDTCNLVRQLSARDGAVTVAAAAVTVSTAVLGAGRAGGGSRDSLKHQVRSHGPSRKNLQISREPEEKFSLLTASEPGLQREQFFISQHEIT